MRERKKISFLLVIITLFTIFFLNNISLNAQQAKPPEEIQKFYGFEGVWEGKFNMQMKGATYTGTHTYTKISDGWGMMMDESIDIANMGTYRAKYLLGYNVSEGKYHMYSISNMGEIRDLVGVWTDSKTLHFEYVGVEDNKTYAEKADFTIKNPDTYIIYDNVTINNVASSMIDMTFNRQK